MVVHYDPDADALTIEVSSGRAVRTVELDESNMVDIASSGAVVAIEILSPREHGRLPEIIESFGLTARADEILRAALEATGAPGGRSVSMTLATNGTATSALLPSYAQHAVERVAYRRIATEQTNSGAAYSERVPAIPV